MAERLMMVGIADLRRHPGSRRRFQQAVVLPGLAISSAAVPDDAEVGVDVELETLSNGLVATGTITVPWAGECRRCLRPVRGESVAEVREIFELRAVEGETYPMAEDSVDLAPMIRDAVLLALPLAPLCGSDCRGPAPEAFPTGPVTGSDEDEGDAAPTGDPRWAALGDLRFDSPDGGE
jgi:uncharacterized protein